MKSNFSTYRPANWRMAVACAIGLPVSMPVTIESIGSTRISGRHAKRTLRAGPPR
ncbi:MAG TPA: hypothetical protein VH370_03680 [Humisphaera sp.]|nr:hypothetical protein [Humisphaera sp.]